MINSRVRPSVAIYRYWPYTACIVYFLDCVQVGFSLVFRGDSGKVFVSLHELTFEDKCSYEGDNVTPDNYML